ncbi:peptidyl-prolyl cis-trans isomerase FKBP13, chloroplastic-like [Hibiscus syriacus]|uniref:peptidyl-prolyl cis-trans isomerase FKBP13, chloroplastic-like n=1 Tax=Hibiscus syriacus TaxID=106335 RepID=UPI001924EE38|nr:peptidyl-prolyl cis-trans isomerase FKBP13, chloroplastic-like [Hibiscus syriacus]
MRESACQKPNFTPLTMCNIETFYIKDNLETNNCNQENLLSPSTAEFTTPPPAKEPSNEHSFFFMNHRKRIEGKTQQNENSNKVLLKRREGIGIGLCVGIDNVLLQFLPQPGPSVAAIDAATVACELTVSRSGLAFCDKVVGKGPEAVKRQLIKAHYVGRLENGKVFDSSYNRGKPLTFRVGVGGVIKGWDQGILGGDGVPPMLAGGKRTLRLPPELGYGMRGAGCKGGSCIKPPDSVLFDVEFIGKA